MKSYTNIEQSKKLAEILPMESSDMHYHYDYDFDELESIPTITEENDHFVLFPKDVRCWSLVALLEWLKLNVKGFIHLQLLGGKYFASWYSPSYAMVEPKFDEKVSEIETYEHNTPISAVIDLIEQLKKAMKGGEE